MKIAMLGSIGNINRLVIPELIEAHHEVTVVTSNDKRVGQIEAMGAQAVVGTMTDLQFLTQTFKGQDAVYLMISGTGTGTDLNASMTKQGTIFCQAIEQAGVKNVVQLSSIGADNAQSGSLYAYHFLEVELKKLTNVHLAFVRPVGFYANLYANLDSIKNDHAIYSNVPATTQQKWVAPADIAAVVLPLLLKTPAGVTVKYAVSDTFSMADFIAELAQAANLPDLHFVQISSEQVKQGMVENGVPEPISTALVTTSEYQQNPAEVYADVEARGTEYGQVKLADFIQEFVKALHHEQSEHQAATLAQNKLEH